jgi:uncharacterized protein YecT (DUF1311 family)
VFSLGFAALLVLSQGKLSLAASDSPSVATESLETPGSRITATDPDAARGGDSAGSTAADSGGPDRSVVRDASSAGEDNAPGASGGRGKSAKAGRIPVPGAGGEDGEEMPAYLARLCEIDAAYDQCLDEAQGVAEAVRDCGDAADEALDAAVSASLEKLRRNIAGDETLSAALEAEQKAWLNVRRAAVDRSLAMSEGLVTFMLAHKVWYDITWRRGEALGYLAGCTDPERDREKADKPR